MPFFRKRVYSTGYLIDKYSIIKLIGQGRFGMCYLVSAHDKEYVFKEIKPKAIKKSGSKVIFESQILSSISHPLIPEIVDIIKKDDIYGYILEYKKGSTIEHMIFGYSHKFTSDEIYRIGSKLIEIIEYLHRNNIVHRDIRVPNVIINEEDVYLIDFGLARFIDNKKYMPCEDFLYLGHLLLHLYYSSFQKTNVKSKPWYNELQLSLDELNFLRKLLGLDDIYKNIYDVEKDFFKLKITQI